jgi:uncharacterized protein
MKEKTEDFKIESEKVGFFRFRKIENKYLLTNDFGKYIKLSFSDFQSFLKGKIKKGSVLDKELERKGFFKASFSKHKKEIVSSYKGIKSNLFKTGPNLHIIVVSKNCNVGCIYCQASSLVSSVENIKKNGNMDKKTARKVVDFIFNTPNKNIGIEFQGGEPLVNWEVVKFITEYVREKEKETKKKVSITLVSNFTLMTRGKLNFLTKNNVSFCTSLDGPEIIHNKNRILKSKNNYKTVIGWIKKIKKEGNKAEAVLTVTKHSLGYFKEIINEYINLGMREIHLRPLSRLGNADKNWKEIGYSTEEFIDFWEKSMDYIIAMNIEKISFSEMGSRIMLRKIINNKDSGYTELSSPCGAVLGQLLYDYDGKIYTCDEGRMTKTDDFLLGNAEDNYCDIITSTKTRAILASSCLENLFCDYCVYGSYCGVCPVKNIVVYGNLFPNITATFDCKLRMAQFDYLFKKLEDQKIMSVFKKWIKR